MVIFLLFFVRFRVICFVFGGRVVLPVHSLFFGAFVLFTRVSVVCLRFLWGGCVESVVRVAILFFLFGASIYSRVFCVCLVADSLFCVCFGVTVGSPETIFSSSILSIIFAVFAFACFVIDALCSFTISIAIVCIILAISITLPECNTDASRVHFSFSTTCCGKFVLLDVNPDFTASDDFPRNCAASATACVW